MKMFGLLYVGALWCCCPDFTEGGGGIFGFGHPLYST